jgi:hypothetical protein
MASNKKRISSRQPKSVHDKKRASNELIKEPVVCEKCKTDMEFYGVDGAGGLKFNCLSCYGKKNIK